MPVTSAPNNLSAYFYGGVFDTEDDEENIAGNFFNDFYQLDLERLVYKNVFLTGKKDKDSKTKRRKDKDDQAEDNGSENEEMETEVIEEKTETLTIADDGIFKVTVGPAPTTSGDTATPNNEQTVKIFRPSPRMNCGLAIKHGILYLYGGMFEDGDKQFTFSDFYALDLKKLDEWKTLIADDTSAMEWLGSDSEESEEEGGDEESEEDSDSDMDTE